MDDEEFRQRRQEKIREIGRTGRTWQWPDTVRHRKWTPAHLMTALAVLLAVLLVVAAILVSVLS